MIKLVRNQINMSLNQVEFYKYDSFYLQYFGKFLPKN